MDEGHSYSGNGKQEGLLERMLRLLPGRRRVTSERELQDLIEESEEEGIINEDEGEMLSSIFEFGETIVREVMVPRTNMVCCPATATVPELIKQILASGHSRIPLYEGTIDRIVGVVYAKDLLRYWGQPAERISLQRMMRKPYFVPEAKRVEDLLREFRDSRVHMAIVIDEYGGTSGLITIEDLLEEIVGDIQDEYDSEEEWLIPDGEGGVLVDARLNIEELEEFFDIEVPPGKFDTVGGYLVDLCGRIPRTGEIFAAAGLEISVKDADDRRINKALIRRAAAAAAGEGSEA